MFNTVPRQFKYVCQPNSVAIQRAYPIYVLINSKVAYNPSTVQFKIINQHKRASIQKTSFNLSLLKFKWRPQPNTVPIQKKRLNTMWNQFKICYQHIYSTIQGFPSTHFISNSNIALNTDQKQFKKIYQHRYVSIQKMIPTQ